MLDVVVVGLNHQTASLELREKVDFSKHAAEKYLPKLAETGSVKAGVVLSTCNRVEIYASGSAAEEVLKDITTFIGQFHQLDDLHFTKALYSKLNRDAVRHLFRVASSLDSMVLGEPQILGQVKEAFYTASNQSLVNPFLDRLFRKAFSVSKRVRTETRIAKAAVSISYASIELAKRIFGQLSDASVMIVGAGEMAELSARHFKEAGVNEMFFANRSYDHAFDLAKEHGGIPIRLEEFPKYLQRVSIVLVSTGAPDYLLRCEHVEAAMAERKQAPMFVIDISVPRNV
jgi:glutamyl-tRNA reductase